MDKRPILKRTIVPSQKFQRVLQWNWWENDE